MPPLISDTVFLLRALACSPIRCAPRGAHRRGDEGRRCSCVCGVQTALHHTQPHLVHADPRYLCIAWTSAGGGTVGGWGGEVRRACARIVCWGGPATPRTGRTVRLTGVGWGRLDAAALSSMRNPRGGVTLGQ